MPSKYIVRNFSENSYFHVFNRGVEKRKIFQDDQDYFMFLYYLEIYLLPIEKVLSKYPKLPFRLHNKNLEKEVDLLCYCLMPNHFHLLLKQKKKDGISHLLKQLTNAYTLYFNNKNERVGSLMQGPFKAAEVKTDDLLIHISRYVHLNPVVAGIGNLENYKWSSFKEYLQRVEGLCKKDEILSQFSSTASFKNFNSDQIDYGKNLERVKHLAID